MNRAAILLVLITSSLYGASCPLGVRETTYLQAGLAVDHPDMGSYSDVRFGEVGQHMRFGTFDVKEGLGFWTDTSQHPGVRNSAFINMMAGVEPRSQNFYMHYFIGPALISTKDSLLGSYFEIAQEIGFGFKDTRECRIGVVVKHLSDAGLSRTNYGRQWMGLEIEFP